MTDPYTEDLRDWESRRPPDQSDDERAAIDALYAEAERRGLFVQHIVPFIAYAEDGTEIAGLHVRENLRLVDDDGNEVASGPATPEQRRADAIREKGTEGHYGPLASKESARPDRQPDGIRKKDQKAFSQRRHTTFYLHDRRPPNQSDDEKAAIRALYTEARRLRQTVDHIVPWRHERLRGLHTLANLQMLSSRSNRIKGNRIMTPAQIQQELETGIRMAEPTDADLQGYVDAGMALWAEEVPENPDTGIALPNWPARYRS